MVKQDIGILIGLEKKFVMHREEVGMVRDDVSSVNCWVRLLGEVKESRELWARTNYSPTKSGSRGARAEEDEPGAEEKGGWSRREGSLKPKDVGEKDELGGGGVGADEDFVSEKKVVVGGKELGVERKPDWRQEE